MILLQSVIAEDTVSSGNYLIHLCNAGRPNSEASKLQDVLPQVYSGLQKVIADLKLGTASSHGYSTFFKDDSNKAEVLRVYEKMAAGNSVARSGNSISLRRPTFICVNNVPATDLLYQFCQEQPNTALMTWLRTDLMPLCPMFWMIKKKAVRTECPLVIANTLTPNDKRLLENQEALLVGNLVHLYHDVNRTFIGTITDVSDLNASQSLLNPPTYALYYAGGYLIIPTLPSTDLANNLKTWQPCRPAALPSQICENHIMNFAAYLKYLPIPAIPMSTCQFTPSYPRPSQYRLTLTHCRSSAMMQCMHRTRLSVVMRVQVCGYQRQ